MKRLMMLTVSALLTVPSYAEIISWQFYDAVLGDGQTVTGGFDFDDSSLQILNVSIALSGSDFHAPTILDRSDPYGNYLSLPFFNDAPLVVNDYSLGLWLESDTLDSDQDVLAFDHGKSGFFTCLLISNGECGLYTGGTITEPGNEEFPLFVSGQLVREGYSTVPVPAAAWLFGSAMLGLVGVKRRGGVA